MSLVAAIREMIAKGLSIEDALTAAEVLEARETSELEARKANDRERKRRQRMASRDKAEVTGSHVTDGTTPLPDKERSPTPPKEINPTPSLRSVTAGARARPETPRQTLLECGLSPDNADAVMAHRRAMRCPLTARAAQLLAKGFLATADPNAAADMMIERGWRGFKPDWFDNERAGNGQGRSKKGSTVEAGRRLTERLVAEERERELQAQRSRGEGDDAVRLLPPQRGQRS